MGTFKRAGLTALPLLACLMAVAATVTAGPVPPVAPAAPGAADPAAPAIAPDPGAAVAVKPVRCEIQRNTAGGTLTLTPVVHADIPVTGAYKFRVTGSTRGGSSNIDQGGPFAAKAKEAVKLSSVSIGAGGSFNATLTVTVDGSTLNCSEKAGSSAS
jgi:hypothetical protein